jgi:hypothetical protein
LYGRRFCFVFTDYVPFSVVVVVVVVVVFDAAVKQSSPTRTLCLGTTKVQYKQQQTADTVNTLLWWVAASKPPRTSRTFTRTPNGDILISWQHWQASRNLRYTVIIQRNRITVHTVRTLPKNSHQAHMAAPSGLHSTSPPWTWSVSSTGYCVLCRHSPLLCDLKRDNVQSADRGQLLLLFCLRSPWLVSTFLARVRLCTPIRQVNNGRLLMQ